MPTEPREIVLEALRRFEDNDLDGVGELYHSDAFVEAPEGWPEGGRQEGWDAIRRQFHRLQEDWESHEFVLKRDVTAGEWGVFDFTWVTQGASSGAPVRAEMAAAYRVRDGKIAEAHFFWDWKHALAAAEIED